MSPAWLAVGILGLVLEVLVIRAMQKHRGYRNYPFLFVYCMALLLSLVVEWAALLDIVTLRPAKGERYALYYWSNEATIQFLIFALMLSLIHRGLGGVQARWLFTLGLGTGVVTAVAISLGFSYSDASVTRWMTGLSRNMSFCSALMNLVLWAVLLRRNVRDRQMLLVSAGIGLQTTGKAIGHSLRGMAPTTVPMGNVILSSSHLLGLFAWWWAFQRMRAPTGRP